MRATRRGYGPLQGPRPATAGRFGCFQNALVSDSTTSTGPLPTSACAPFPLLDPPDPGRRCCPVLRPFLDRGAAVGGGGSERETRGWRRLDSRAPGPGLRGRASPLGSLPALGSAGLGSCALAEREGRRSRSPGAKNTKKSPLQPSKNRSRTQRGDNKPPPVCVKLRRTGEQGGVEPAIRPLEVEDESRRWQPSPRPENRSRTRFLDSFEISY